MASVVELIQGLSHHQHLNVDTQEGLRIDRCYGSYSDYFVQVSHLLLVEPWPISVPCQPHFVSDLGCEIVDAGSEQIRGVLNSEATDFLSEFIGRHLDAPLPCQ